MNKQYTSPAKRGIEWTDYTWNPVGGCQHKCRWQMPDHSPRSPHRLGIRPTEPTLNKKGESTSPHPSTCRSTNQRT